jgi:hypothetical protein
MDGRQFTSPVCFLPDGYHCQLTPDIEKRLTIITFLIVHTLAWIGMKKNQSSRDVIRKYWRVIWQKK